MREVGDLQRRCFALIKKNKHLSHHLKTKDGKTHRYEPIIKKLNKNSLVIDAYLKQVDALLSQD